MQVAPQEIRTGDRFANDVGEVQWTATADARRDGDLARVAVTYRDGGTGERTFSIVPGFTVEVQR